MLEWLLIAAVVYTATWLAPYLLMRWLSPPRDRIEMEHMNRIGRRASIAMAVVVLILLVYWMMR